MDEGFIQVSLNILFQALQITNFHDDYSKAHSSADIGGEFVLTKFGDLSYTQVLQFL
jgi:hypothetical protein